MVIPRSAGISKAAGGASPTRDAAVRGRPTGAYASPIAERGDPLQLRRSQSATQEGRATRRLIPSAT
jgi:hypothetical protein